MTRKELLKRIKYSLRFLPDKMYLKIYYFLVFKKRLNLKKPVTFNEKLQWLKIYDRKKEYVQIVDKYAVREYIKNTIGEEYLVPIYGVWNNFDDIDFNKLPSKFVLKCTHDSGGIVVCHDKKKLDLDSAKRKIEKCLKTNYYYVGREWPYKEVKPQIIAEKLLEYSSSDKEIVDYKLMCFNGKVKCSFVCSERNASDGLKVDFYDNDWKLMPFTRKYKNSGVRINKPTQFDKMIKLAEKLSQNIPFVRVDFYEIDGKIYFGELTLYPGCGFEKFYPGEYDKILGQWLKLEEK